MQSEITATFSDRLEDLIRDSGKDMRTLAKEIGISTSALSNYRNDSAEAGITAFKKIVNHFQVSYEYLFGESEIRSPKNIELGKELGLYDDEAVFRLKNSGMEPYNHILNAFFASDNLDLLINELYDAAHIQAGEHASFSPKEKKFEYYDEGNELYKFKFDESVDFNMRDVLKAQYIATANRLFDDVMDAVSEKLIAEMEKRKPVMFQLTRDSIINGISPEKAIELEAQINALEEQ